MCDLISVDTSTRAVYLEITSSVTQLGNLPDIKPEEHIPAPPFKCLSQHATTQVEPSFQLSL